MKKNSRALRVSGGFEKLFFELKREVPPYLKNPDFTDELVNTMKSSGVDKQLKNLLRRRFPKL